MPERDDLDRLLDSALSTYAEPRSGVEKRALARVDEARNVGSAPRRRWLVWAVAIPLAACLALYVSISGIRQRHTKNVQQPQKHEQASLPPLQATPQKALHSEEQSRARIALKAIQHPSQPSAITDAPSPRLDVFPAPQPLSAQEQALIALAKLSPDLRQEALVRVQEDDTPLRISEIQIPPISLPDKGKN
jgi:hypothetical protein